MNWKLWQWPARCAAELNAICAQRDRYMKERDTWRRAAIESGEENSRLEQRLRERDAVIADLQKQMGWRRVPRVAPETDQQLLSALAVVDDTTPLWRAVHQLIDLHDCEEMEALLRPGLDDQARHYNAGRVAVLTDLRFSLVQKWREAQRVNQETQ
jgi:hypothetical protein